MTIQPKAPSPYAAPALPDPTAAVADASTTEATAAPNQSKGLPDEILQIPAMQAVLAGKPAAVSASMAEFQKRPEAKAIITHKDALLQAGFGLYRSLAGDMGVVFNQLHMHPQELQEADKAGKLQEIAPPFDQVNDSVSKAGPEDHPIMTTGEVPAGPKGMPMPTPPQANSRPMPAPAPASVQNKLASARTKNIQPGSPTSGAQPGAGRLLNSVLKPVI